MKGEGPLRLMKVSGNMQDPALTQQRIRRLTVIQHVNEICTPDCLSVFLYLSHSFLSIKHTNMENKSRSFVLFTCSGCLIDPHLLFYFYSRTIMNLKIDTQTTSHVWRSSCRPVCVCLRRWGG